MSDTLIPLALTLLVYPGVIFTGACLWAGAFLRRAVIRMVCRQGVPSPLDPLREIASAFGRPWFVFQGAPNFTAVWVAVLGLLAGFASQVLMPYPGSPLFAIGPIGEGSVLPWSLPVLWVLLEFGALSHVMVAFTVPDPRAVLLGWRRLALFRSYLLPQLLVLTALAVGTGTMDLLKIARSGGIGLISLKLALGIVSYGILLARVRVGPFDTDGGFEAGRLDQILPGQLRGLLMLGRGLVWLASISLTVYAFVPMPPTGTEALLAWAVYVSIMTAVGSLVEAEQPTWHSQRWQRVLWGLGVPVAGLSLLVGFVMRGT